MFISSGGHFIYEEISQEVFETSVGAHFSPEFNLNQTTFTDLPSRRKDSKKKKTSLLVKLKNLTELCCNIKIKEEQTLDEIISLVDEALSFAREKLEAGTEGSVERNTETTHVKQTESTTKDYVNKNVLPLPRQPTKHLASGRVGATADMKRQWYRVKIKLDEINEIKSKMLDIPICREKMKQRYIRVRESRLLLLNLLKMLKDKFILNITTNSKKKFQVGTVCQT